MRLYGQNVIAAFGPLERENEYWQWRVSRRGYDHVYVAIADPCRAA